ncbi:MAG: hypothetical protein JKP98_17310 [Rhodobacteraceae bacterium]|nr:hypothetical protein [Paracoccaceae bacterium]
MTILVGENGVGKSTLVEAIAALAGFGPGGGSQAHRGVAPAESAAVLGQHVRGAWLPKVTEGWFFRAETFHALTGVLADARRIAAARMARPSCGFSPIAWPGAACSSLTNPKAPCHRAIRPCCCGSLPKSRPRRMRRSSWPPIPQF